MVFMKPLFNIINPGTGEKMIIAEDAFKEKKKEGWVKANFSIGEEKFTIDEVSDAGFAEEILAVGDSE